MDESVKDRKILRNEAEFPLRFKNIKEPPEAVYVAGMLPEPEQKAVAIIGSRGCSFYGRQMAEWFGSSLAREGVVVVSGMATGIDGISQRAALSVGGRSVGVLGCGLDICYPAANRDLYQALRKKGCLLSEYPAGSPPEAWHFPRRNRLISALADLVLVIEAKEKSGTLLTVEYALEQGKEVYALPGRVNDPLSAGCNRLLEQGAGLALTPAHVLFALYGRMPGSVKEKGSQDRFAGLSEEERFLLQYLDQDGKTLAQLLQQIQMEGNREVSVQESMQILLGLQAKKIILQEAGRYFLPLKN